MSENTQTAIESVLHEERVFPPPAGFSEQAHIKSFEEYEEIYNAAAENPELFWASVAENLHWFKKWDTVLEWNEPFAKWFVGGTLNASYNCVDRHLETFRKNKAAIIWEGEPGETRTLTYQQLHRQVSKFANVLKKSGIKTGDRVALYMPLVPELAIADARLRSNRRDAHVIFGGFSADAIRDRVIDGGCKMVVTADGGYRRGREIKLKEIVDEAVRQTPMIENVIVFKRTGSKIHMEVGR